MRNLLRDITDITDTRHLTDITDMRLIRDVTDIFRDIWDSNQHKN